MPDNPYLHHSGSLEIPSWKEVLKAKILKGKYELKLEFPEGWGGGGGGTNQKNLHGGSMDIFCKNTLLNIIKENKMFFTDSEV